MTTLADLDETKPDGATEPVAVLDDYQREAKLAIKTSFAVEHDLTGPHKFKHGVTADRPAPAFDGRVYINEQTKTLQLDDSAAWGDLVHYYTRIKIGTYIGDGTSNKGITGIGFSPTAAWVYPLTGNNPSFFKGVDFAAGNSHKEDDATTSITGIDTLDADGFTIDAAANVNTIVYQYVVMRDRA